MRDAHGLWLGLLAILLGAGGPVAGADPAGPESDEEMLALLEFLGDAETAGDEWNGFFDSLPERLPEPTDDTILPGSGPVAAEEAKP